MITLNKRDSIFWKWIESVFLFFVVTFPFVNYNSFLFGGTSSRSVNLIFLATVCGISYAVWLFRKGNSLMIPKSPIAISIIAYLVFLTISALFGMSPATSFWSVATRTSGIWYFLSLGFIIYFLWKLFSDRARQNRLVLCVVLSTALYSVFSLLSPEGLGWMFNGTVRDAFTFGNSTFAGMYIFGAFILSLYYIFQASKKKWWMYAIPFVLLINPNIISKGVWFGNFSEGFVGEARASAYVIVLSVVVLFVIWLISKIKNIKLRSGIVYSVFALSIVVMIFSAVSLLSHDGYLRKAYLRQATGARPLVWEMSEKIIIQKPYFGWGADNFERVFESNYDNRILQDEYGNEAWFDRAHNVFIDQLVDNGFIGLIFYIAIYLITILSLIYTSLKSTEKNDKLLASFLIVYSALHFVELQTAFDTTISYFMLAIMIALAIVLYDRTRTQIFKKENEYNISGWQKHVISCIALIFLTWSFVFGLVPFVRAEFMNGYIRTIGSAEKRISVYPVLFGSPVDEHSFLWRTSTDFQRGLAENPKVLEDPKKVQNLKKELVIFENAYRDYIKKNPNHFRARLNLADILIYQRLFNVDKLLEAQTVLDEAIRMVPQAPQAYWMKAVAYIYMKKFDLAREYAKKAIDLNPLIKQSQDVQKYVEKSIKDFPSIDLYFFKQI